MEDFVAAADGLLEAAGRCRPCREVPCASVQEGEEGTSVTGNIGVSQGIHIHLIFSPVGKFFGAADVGLWSCWRVANGPKFFLPARVTISPGVASFVLFCFVFITVFGPHTHCPVQQGCLTTVVKVVVLVNVASFGMRRLAGL